MKSKYHQDTRESVEPYLEGKIENIGVSNFNLQECKLAKSILNKAGIPLFGVQDHYGLIDRANGQRMDYFEIYLPDARKVAPGKWKTVIRHPIKRI